jgi:hypothetical protein
MTLPFFRKLNYPISAGSKHLHSFLVLLRSQNILSIDAINASRGSLTAWNQNRFKLISSFTRSYTINSLFESESNATRFWLSNVHGPNLDESRPEFFQELKEIAEQINGPWLLAGDFNAIRAPHERSTLHMSQNENLFDYLIRDLTLQEIPLLDRNFTWSNMQQPPILSKLDRVCINPDWDSILPNCSVISLPRTTSDHFPLKIEVSTAIPKPHIFRYCNNWKYKNGFRDVVSGLQLTLITTRRLV